MGNIIQSCYKRNDNATLPRSQGLVAKYGAREPCDSGRGKAKRWPSVVNHTNDSVRGASPAT